MEREHFFTSQMISLKGINILENIRTEKDMGREHISTIMETNMKVSIKMVLQMVMEHTPI